MKKVYAIATKENVCHGHGDYSDELRIHQEGIYEDAHWGPVFLNRKDAEVYLDNMKWNSGKIVVEIPVFDKEE